MSSYLDSKADEIKKKLAIGRSEVGYSYGPNNEKSITIHYWENGNRKSVNFTGNDAESQALRYAESKRR